jgi:AraC-like DNA-binding protein/mannose-6-phosphate isomerase-like protein (cupin superfamily)
MSIRQLSTHRPTRQLRWTQDGSKSLRAYTVLADDEPCPCVSTRSGELNLVLEGEVVIEVGPAKQQLSIGAGEACLVPRGLPHTVRVPAGGRVLLVDVLSEVADEGLRFVPAGELPASVFRTIDHAWTQRAQDAFRPAFEAAAEVVHRMRARAPLAIETSSSTRRMMRAKQILEADFANPPSLADLAKKLGTNEFYLLRAFKKHFGFPPFAYAQFLRREHFVWELLAARTPKTLLRLSSEAGFSDYSTFERRIRDMFGRTPSALIDDDGNGRLGPSE